jgi:hypothetical protein
MGDAARPASGSGVVPAGARTSQRHGLGVGAAAAADAAHYYESDEEAVYHDALSCFDDDEAEAALAAAEAAAARSAAGGAQSAAPGPALTPRSPGSAPLPAEPLDDDDWLPPNAVPAAARAAAVNALRARILDTPDAGACTAAPHMRSLSAAFPLLASQPLRAPAAPRADAVAHWEDRSPATLERFLRARDYDVPIAAALLLEHRAWRQGFGWAVGFERLPPKLVGFGTIALQARSRRGSPLLIIVTRRHDKCVRVALVCVCSPH